MFDIMDLEDEERNKLLKLDDNQMQVSGPRACYRRRATVQSKRHHLAAMAEISRIV